MSEKAPILFVKPAEEISFKGNYNSNLTSYLMLRNLVDQPVCFKIKTTASSFYCAQPNLGVIKAKNRIVIEVQARPYKCTAMNFKDHLFLVQAIVMKKDASDYIQAWQNIENPAEIMNHRLKCKFEFTSSET